MERLERESTQYSVTILLVHQVIELDEITQRTRECESANIST